MAATVTSAAAPPSLLRPPSHASSPFRPMPLRLLHRRALSLAAAAAAVVRQDAAAWTQAPLTHVRPATADGSLFHVGVDVSDAPGLAEAHVAPGQYLQLRPAGAEKPSFLAIASPPDLAVRKGQFEFLVKRVSGSVAEVLCGLDRGDLVELSAVMGKGFQVERISPPKEATTVLIFATGSGISAIRSLIESDFSASERSDVRLYYGARNLQRMAYQDKFKDWEDTGVRIIPVLSQPEDRWDGECGYVQAVFSRAKPMLNPLSTGAVLCGHKQMTEDVTSVLVDDGVSQDKILKNF